MEIKTEFVKLCNQNHARFIAQQKAAEYLASNREKRKQKTINVVMTVITAFTCALTVWAVHSSNANANTAKVEIEQKYIARYGVTFDNGNTIKTYDGNTWTLIDAPEHEDGTEVRVLFDSMETPSPLDDIIIDITEM